MASFPRGAGTPPNFLLAIPHSILKHHHLIALLVRRNVEAVFRGSMLGKLWAVLAPLLRLTLYTFVFGVVIGAKWPGPPRSHFEVALLYFVGLTLFDFFFDCINAAPSLMQDYANFVKKVVFPLEILGFVTVGAGLVRFCVTACIVLVFYLVIDGIPGPTALAIPLLLLPLVLVAASLVWIMAVIGAYAKDLRQLIGLLSMVAMYLSPIFFPVSQVARAAPWAVPVFYANPLTFVIESSRAALFAAQWPNWTAWALYTIGAWLFASLAYRWFMRSKRVSPMSSEPVIRAEDLGKAYRIYRNPQDRLKQAVLGGRRYEEFWALQGVNLQVSRGETLGVIGRNGAGKSTFLQLVCGTLRPSTGSVTVDGKIAALLELGSGFNPEFTGRENVQLSASVLGLSAAQIKRRFAEIEDFADIGAYIDEPVKHYSSGMYARLAFSVCAHVDADILIVDEILAVGDIAFQQKCMRFLHRFRQQGTLLFVSHDSEAVLRLCDRVLWLENGEVRGEGEAREMCRRYRVTQSEQMGADQTGSEQTGAGQTGEAAAPQSSGFRAGGLSKKLAPPPAPPPTAFAFNPEAPGPVQGGAELLEAGLYDAQGVMLGAVAGGEDIELRLSVRATHALAKPAMAFVLRDRLGQILFGDESWSFYGQAPPSVAANQNFAARFQFRLPFMASGAYAIEIFLFDGPALLVHQRDAAVLQMQSRHVSSGLANLAMRHVSLALTP